MPNQRNIQTVALMTDKFNQAKSAFFTNYKGMSVAHVDALRKELFEAGVEYRVAKKTLSRIAAKNAGFESIDEVLDGQTGIAFAFGDPLAPPNVINEFIKKNKLENLYITGCIFERRVFGPDKVNVIATLPSREQLIAKFMGTLNAPMSNLVGVLNGAMGKLSGVLKSLSEVKK